MTPPILQKIPKPVLYIIGLIILGILFAQIIFPYTAPFVIAILLAIIIEPLVKFLEKKLNLHRGLAALLVITLLFGLVAIVGVNSLLRATNELHFFIMSDQQLPLLNFEGLDSWLQSYRALQEHMPMNITEIIEESIADLNNMINATARNLLTGVVNLIKDIPTIFIYTLITFIATVFMSKDKAKIEHELLKLIPKNKQQKAIQIYNGVLNGAMGYIRAQLIIVTITACIATVSFLIMNIPYVWFLALLIFIMDFIPIIGPSLVFLPWAGWALINGDYQMGIFFIFTYGCIAATRQILEPKLIGDRIGVHPLLTLFSLFVGVRLLGLIGFIIAPLLVITIKTILFTADEFQTA